MVVGITKKGEVENLAIFTSEKLAKHHTKTTFKDLGYKILLCTPVAKSSKEAVVIPENIALDKGKYAFTKLTVRNSDWENLEANSIFGTLNEFVIPRINEKSSTILGEATKVLNKVNKVLSLEVESSEGDELTEIEVSAYVLHSVESPIPYKPAMGALHKELEKTLIQKLVPNYVDNGVQEESSESTSEVEDTEGVEVFDSEEFQTIFSNDGSETNQAELAEKAKQEELANQAELDEKAKQEELAKKAELAEKAKQEELAKKAELAEKAKQEELAKQAELAEKAKQEELAKQAELAEKAKQEELAKQAELAEKAKQEELAKQAELAEKAKQEELAKQAELAEKAKQEELAKQAELAEKAKQEELAKQKALEEQAKQSAPKTEKKKIDLSSFEFDL